MLRRTLIILLVCMLPFAAARACAGATVYTGGPIYAKAGMAPAEAAVVEDGQFRFVGDINGALLLAGSDCKRIDLQGRIMMPSFFDAHAHPNLGSALDLRELHYDGAVPTPKEYVEHIRRYLAAHPDLPALRGSGWENGAFPDALADKALLDQVSTDIPIYIRSSDQHSAWVNSKALALANFGRDTPDPDGGHIERNADGEPCGTLRDNATLVADAALPPVTVEEQKELILKFQNMAHSYGITGFMCAMVTPGDNQYEAYRALLAEGKLRSYVQLAFLMTPDTYKDTVAYVDREARTLEAATGVLLGLRTAKFFMDGAIVGQTGYLLDDYTSRPGYRGEPQWASDMTALGDAFRMCDENGLRIHIHAVGDAAARMALDGLEDINPNRHAITHLELAAPEDIARFARLQAIATINPYWFCKSMVFNDSELVQLGSERTERMFPAKSLYDSGVQVAAASDFPVTAVPNPLIGIEMATTRTLIEPWRGGRSAEACSLNPSEAIFTEQAVDAFTLGAAYANGLDGITGSIEPGKSADFVLLDRNIFEGAPSEAKVLETWFQGECVYQAQ